MGKCKFDILVIFFALCAFLAFTLMGITACNRSTIGNAHNSQDVMIRIENTNHINIEEDNIEHDTDNHEDDSDNEDYVSDNSEYNTDSICEEYEINSESNPNSENTEYVPRRPMIALTFDDGPSPHTDIILDLIETYGGQVTFFVLGNRVASRPYTIRRMLELNNEVLGHSWDHTNFAGLTEDAIRRQITYTSEVLYEVTGIRPPQLIRTPFGITSTRVFNVAYELEYSLVRWSVDTMDWRYRCADHVYYFVMANAVDGAIVLLHDIHYTTVDAMRRAIPHLIEAGFDLVTVSEIIEYVYGSIEVAKEYNGVVPRRNNNQENDYHECSYYYECYGEL